MDAPDSGSGTPPRRTRQRDAVEQVLAGSADFRSAQQVYLALRGSGATVGLSTVYRALQSMAAAGQADMLLGDDGEARYRNCSASHHHHLVCRQCGATVEVAGPSVERWAERVAREHGYREVRHTLEISGLCPPCAAEVSQ
ncbi:MAG: Fur family transcriptional regulator [Candidatus Nanopelagicales bacterium]